MSESKPGIGSASADPRTETTPGETGAVAAGRAAGFPPLRNVLEVAVGGMVGAGLRYAFLQAFPADPGRFPLTIFVENVLGAFLLGMVLTMILARPRAGWDARPFLATGVLGSFTTFSNLSFDLVRLAETGHSAVAVVYASASIAAGLAAAFAGLAAGRRVIRRAG